MENVTYLTLAAVRAADPEGFDAEVRAAVHAAADDVGHVTLLSAFDNSNSSDAALSEKAA